MNEDLTKEDSLIFKKAREEMKQGRLHSVWTRAGLVWVKTSEAGQPFQLSE
jgi:hypothetical protein